eukprot:scaffold12815_cov69-Phaeocystis_antarctica.AAC.4
MNTRDGRCEPRVYKRLRRPRHRARRREGAAAVCTYLHSARRAVHHGAHSIAGPHAGGAPVHHLSVEKRLVSRPYGCTAHLQVDRRLVHGHELAQVEHRLLKSQLVHTLIARHEIGEVFFPPVQSGADCGPTFVAECTAQLDKADLQFCQERRDLHLSRLALARQFDEIAPLHVERLGAPARETPRGHVLRKPRHLTVLHDALVREHAQDAPQCNQRPLHNLGESAGQHQEQPGDVLPESLLVHGHEHLCRGALGQLSQHDDAVGRLERSFRLS